MANILIVDDEKEIADLVEIYLKNENYTVYKYYSSKKVLENKKIIFLGFILSFTLETMQFIFSIGSCDITDIITNTIGTIVGLFLYLILEKCLKDKTKTNQILNILGMIGSVLFIFLILLLIIGNL